MSVSRAILATLLIIIGVMVENLWSATNKLTGEVSNLSQRIDSLPQPMVLQSATAQISKPRVSAVRHFYNKAPTIIDRICKP